MPSFDMEDIAFNDWPGQPVDFGSGGNSWLPAYGLQTPSALLDRDDFLGNPDADYFLQGSSNPCLYLETIHEETSDDLRSDSDISEMGPSPLGWLATDSETDSVICMDATNDTDCESDREIACPIKRRRQDNNFLSVAPVDDDYQSLSRSSSLLQFETLEKQCQETSSSSPSIYSNKTNISQEINENSDESGDSETTLAPEKSYTNLIKTWRSFDSLTPAKSGNKEGVSAENLSEDSGYSDHLYNNNNFTKKVVNSNNNNNVNRKSAQNEVRVVKKQATNFAACDYFEGFQPKFVGNLGVSCQNLSVFEEEQFVSDWRATNINLEKSSPECRGAKYNCTSASEPNLLLETSAADSSVCAVLSVPKNLDLITTNNVSVAAKNWDLADLTKNLVKLVDMASYKREGSYAEAMKEFNRVDLSDDEHSLRNCNKIKSRLPQHPVVEFDKKVLQPISESIHSVNSSSIADNYLNNVYSNAEPIIFSSTSTPNLTSNGSFSSRRETLITGFPDPVQDFPRKTSLINSTSTSYVSDVETLNHNSNFDCGSSVLSKGVHFSPVVSEVNWRDSRESTPSTIERESSYSLSSTPEREREHVNALTQLLLDPRFLPSNAGSGSQPNLNSQRPLPQDRRISHSQSQPDVSSRIKRRGSQLVKKDVDGCTIKAYVDGDGIQYKHTHLDLDSAFESAPSPKSHVVTSGSTEVNRGDAVAGMEALDAPRKEHPSKLRAGGKLGGFFQRLASFRFSNRKEKKKRNGDTNRKVADVPSAQAPPKVATKADYIYIPLKGPSSGADPNSNSPSQPMCKPPLPRAPPRVVGACVKGARGGDQQHHRRRRTIDSGEPCPRPMEPMGLIETDLDTEVTVITSGANVKTRSLLNLGAEPRLGALLDANNHQTDAEGAYRKNRPHKSMEFLLDKQNLKVVEPPENELQKSERVMSEHQLRVQRSLQKLTVPDWYKQSQIPSQGFLLKKHSMRESRWTGTSSSKTTSLSSLGSNNTQSPVLLSPTTNAQPFVRWSTSKLNSTASSPCASTRSSFNARQPNGSISPSSARSSFSYRQPYMGWRSQERLCKPRTPAERLANSLLGQNSQNAVQVTESPEIQTSIKEVTSAIVHYVSGLRPDAECDGSSVSPRGSQKLYWVESSFVGVKPLDSPQTPVTLTPAPPTSLRLELQAHNGESVHA